MKLDRNKNKDGMGKYALINLRKSDFDAVKEVEEIYQDEIAIEWGDDEKGEFFVIKLKDKFAQAALYAYADAVEREASQGRADSESLFEYAGEIRELARDAENHPLCKIPD